MPEHSALEIKAVPCERCPVTARGQPREGEDDSDLDSLSDLSDEDDDEEGEDELERSSDDDDDDEEVKGKTKSKTKAREPAKLSKSDLKELADGDEDLVEDLELSDDD
ncbi:hypothetical protein JZ751_017733 [Albula glossodonta]|uniref:Uncharacterized protein n=1 Tax=Albula glossodonta TaxID=121402 RepID=A0A8T2PP81_9TELE|nr:hypothetical protein JZ751_017733 [Albula glossodonta]